MPADLPSFGRAVDVAALLSRAASGDDTGVLVGEAIVVVLLDDFRCAARSWQRHPRCPPSSWGCTPAPDRSPRAPMSWISCSSSRRHLGAVRALRPVAPSPWRTSSRRCVPWRSGSLALRALRSLSSSSCGPAAACRSRRRWWPSRGCTRCCRPAPITHAGRPIASARGPRRSTTMIAPWRSAGRVTGSTSRWRDRMCATRSAPASATNCTQLWVWRWPIRPSTQVHLWGIGPSFCSGGDLDEFGTAPDPVTAHLVRTSRSPALDLARCGSRVTAHVHGAAVGAGMEWAAFAGTVVARTDATFPPPGAGHGLGPGCRRHGQPGPADRPAAHGLGGPHRRRDGRLDRAPVGSGRRGARHRGLRRDGFRCVPVVVRRPVGPPEAARCGPTIPGHGRVPIRRGGHSRHPSSLRRRAQRSGSPRGHPRAVRDAPGRRRLDLHPRRRPRRRGGGGARRPSGGESHRRRRVVGGRERVPVHAGRSHRPGVGCSSPHATAWRGRCSPTTTGTVASCW